jgi:amidophosphoribosyltransferase
MRERGVAIKFNALNSNLTGKRVVMIDDSLVRGTTAGPLVKLVRDAGATEVHLRLTCPPIVNACHFGVDMGHNEDLIAARLDLEQLSRDGMLRAIGREQGYCTACFTGEYPVQISPTNGKAAFEGAIG